MMEGRRTFGAFERVVWFCELHRIWVEWVTILESDARQPKRGKSSELKKKLRTWVFFFVWFFFLFLLFAATQTAAHPHFLLVFLTLLKKMMRMFHAVSQNLTEDDLMDVEIDPDDAMAIIDALGENPELKLVDGDFWNSNFIFLFLELSCSLVQNSTTILMTTIWNNRKKIQQKKKRKRSTQWNHFFVHICIKAEELEEAK